MLYETVGRKIDAGPIAGIVECARIGEFGRLVLTVEYGGEKADLGVVVEHVFGSGRLVCGGRAGAVGLVERYKVAVIHRRLYGLANCAVELIVHLGGIHHYGYAAAEGYTIVFCGIADDDIIVVGHCGREDGAEKECRQDGTVNVGRFHSVCW